MIKNPKRITRKLRSLERQYEQTSPKAVLKRANITALFTKLEARLQTTLTLQGM